MKLYAPEYYKSFKCIADKCKHSCCIGWEIDIDSNTFEKYRSLSHPYGSNILESIDTTEIPHFKLTCGERCPHLNKSGLCNIIFNVGESYLCDICREHPRFYNSVGNRMEVGLGMACEEACRIILSSDNYNIFSEINESDDEEDYWEFNALELRGKLYNILSNPSLNRTEKLTEISNNICVSPCDISDDEWKEIIDSLEYLNESHKTLFSAYSSNSCVSNDLEKILERVLAYFIFRHCSSAKDEDEFRNALGFCLFCEQLLASLLVLKNPKSMEEIIPLAVAVSEEIEYSEDNTEAIIFEFSLL